MSEPIRILLVDDHKIVRQGVRAFLDAHEGIDVIGEAGSGAAALKMIEEHVPDVVLMDLMMPSMDGATATGERCGAPVAPADPAVCPPSGGDHHRCPACLYGAPPHSASHTSADLLERHGDVRIRGSALVLNHDTRDPGPGLRANTHRCAQ